MAGYNRGIVATRKLNEKNKARLGRGGDTEIREVDGRKSHVNALEAYLIDVNGKAGEEYAKKVGAGTINPLTGMPEYHNLNQLHQHLDSMGSVLSPSDEAQGVSYTVGSVEYDNEGNIIKEQGKVVTPTSTDPAPPVDYSYEALSNVTGKQLQAFDPTLGAGDVKYFQDIFTDKPFEFLEEEQTLAMGALGRTMGSGLGQAAGARDLAIQQSGLATSGTITQGYETQKKDLLQDYTAGSATALETLQLGKEGADLDFRQAEYLEKKRQLDELYADVGSIPA